MSSDPQFQHDKMGYAVFPIGENQFQAIRQRGADGVLKFTEMENGDTKLEMLQHGKVNGTGTRKNRQL